jgi:hypothetical protein
MRYIHTTTPRKFMFMPMFIPTGGGSSRQVQEHPYVAVKNDIIFGRYDNANRVYELSIKQINSLTHIHNRVNQDVTRWSHTFPVNGLVGRIAITGFGTLLSGSLVSVAYGIIHDEFTSDYSSATTITIGMLLSLMISGAGCGVGVITTQFGKHTVQYAKNMYNYEKCMKEFYEEYHKILKEGRDVIEDRA